MKLTLSCIFLATLVGCATVPSGAPSYSAALPAPQGYATVYFYRVGAPPTLRKPNVLVDNVRVAEPPELTYTWLYVPAGERSFSIEWAWDTKWPAVSFKRQLTAGNDYFIKISGSFENKGITGFNQMTFMLGSNVALISRDEAEAELRTCCKFIRPEVQSVP